MKIQKLSPKYPKHCSHRKLSQGLIRPLVFDLIIITLQDDLNLIENGGLPMYEGRGPPPAFMPFGPYGPPMLPLKRGPQWTVDRNMKLLAYISIVVLTILLLIIVIIVLIVFFQHYGM